MKKIGILFGRERSFPMAFIERANSKNIENISAEAIRIDKAMQADHSGYAVIIDRISQDIPFYRTWLKNAALTGTTVINNPFWWSADDKFFNNCVAAQAGIPVPKTVMLPSYERPPETTGDSFTNLAYPLDWESIFDYVGFPAYLKPYQGGGGVQRLTSRQEFYQVHKNTGKKLMMLQEEIVFEEYYRCYCIGRKFVHVMPYEPRNPFGQRYDPGYFPTPERRQQMEEIVLRINELLGYDFNCVEFAVRDGLPYAIDFFNPAPEAEPSNIGDENFEWVVETAADYAIQMATAHGDGKANLDWGEFVKNSKAKNALT